jgi:hypothetical protein
MSQLIDFYLYNLLENVIFRMWFLSFSASMLSCGRASVHCGDADYCFLIFIIGGNAEKVKYLINSFCFLKEFSEGTYPPLGGSIKTPQRTISIKDNIH